MENDNTDPACLIDRFAGGRAKIDDRCLYGVAADRQCSALIKLVLGKPEVTGTKSSRYKCPAIKDGAAEIIPSVRLILDELNVSIDKRLT